MKEINAKGTKGYLMYNFHSQEYFFRIYENSLFKDYKIKAEELQVEIISDSYALYETESENYFVDFSSKALGKEK
jgi:hypothetical protein